MLSIRGSSISRYSLGSPTSVYRAWFVLGFLGISSSGLGSACRRLVRTTFLAAPATSQPALAAPYVNTSPVREDEIDGLQIFKPAGDKRAIGHLLYFHGLGGLSKQEIEFLHRLAAGKFQGKPVTVVAPVAQSLAPRDISFSNLQSFYSLARFVRQQPRDIQNLLLTSLTSDENFFAQTRKMMQAVGNPPWWYPFVFEPTPDRDEPAPERVAPASTKPATFSWHSLGLPKSHALKPDFDATIKMMFRTAEEIAPRTDAVLDRIGAVPGHICASGFSQGVGLAIIFSAILRPGKFCHLVVICASHIKTPNTPAVSDTKLEVDVILPRGDPILETTGFTDTKARRDLEADFHGRSRIWRPPGSHAVDGHVAHIAGMQIVNSLRNSHRKSAAHSLSKG
jgi:predicted esterase